MTKTKPDQLQPVLLPVPQQPFANPSIARALRTWREQMQRDDAVNGFNSNGAHARRDSYPK